MTWVKYDDQFLKDPMVLEMTPSAIILYQALLAYSSYHLTNGVISTGAMRHACDTIATRSRQRGVKRLLACGAILARDGGWFIPRWQEHIQSKDSVLRRRQATNLRVKKLRCNAVTDTPCNAAPGPARTKRYQKTGISSPTTSELVRQKPPRKPKNSEPVPTPGHLLRLQVEALFERVTNGQKMVWSAGHSAQAKRLASALGVEEVARRWENCCLDPPGWMSDGAPDFLTFSRHHDQCAVTGNRKNGSHGKNGKMTASDAARLTELVRQAEERL